jgi:rhodanese-related sulfurtransferase
VTTSTTTAYVSRAELRGQLGTADQPRILDVRTPGEFESAHIPGSYNVPLDQLREHRDELCRTLGEGIVLVCRSGARAQQAQQVLDAAGLPGLHVLAGGIAAWEAAGAPLTRGRTRWDLARQVRRVAGAMVLAAVLASLVVPPLKWVAAFIGGGLVVAALTNTCAMGMLLARMPWNRGASCDLQTMVRQLGEAR